MSRSALAAAALGVVAAGLGVWLFVCNARASELASEREQLKAVVASQGLELAQVRANADVLSERGEALAAENSAMLVKLQAFEAKQAARISKHEEFTVAAGALHPYTLAVDTVPGLLFGNWRASGTSFGGADDTLGGFRLTDPKDALLNSSGNMTQWKFAVRVTEAGTYTFVFDNKGLIRSTARKVFLDVTYLPD